MDLTFFIRNEDGLYERVTENHRQKAHDPAHLKEMLEAAGFSRVRIFGDRTFEAPGDEELRVHICAVRE